jgi:hypothetical protein
MLDIYLAASRVVSSQILERKMDVLWAVRAWPVMYMGVRKAVREGAAANEDGVRRHGCAHSSSLALCKPWASAVAESPPGHEASSSCTRSGVARRCAVWPSRGRVRVLIG